MTHTGPAPVLTGRRDDPVRPRPPRGRRAGLFHWSQDPTSPTPQAPTLVVDVWESEEAFRQFGATLGPILRELGVEGVRPRTYPVLNVVTR
ncbi:hypothetical protein Saso_49610 [Streptomyces asoensis]|uniref:ABM domain-containing protein n=1 Tax=Streptomyces asoensis TaxID=249586 RepID=A0ABQ3S5C8_9ACTN|nr:hypothetical protein GCM10010496_30070 [Streptomyces asoensis]GHI63311.1 hypothetical protein Saso_49610 [Streptomyces asoensis]